MMAEFDYADRSDSSIRYSLGPSAWGLLIVQISWRPWRDWPINFILIGGTGNLGALGPGTRAYAVPIPPLAAHQGAKFVGVNEADGHWQLLPDWRGETFYRKDTGAPYVIRELGFDPTADYMLTPTLPPSDIGLTAVWSWDDAAWILVDDHRGDVYWDKSTAQRIVIATPGAVAANLIGVQPYIEGGGIYAPDRWNESTQEWDAYIIQYNPTTGEYIDEAVVPYGPNLELPQNSTQVNPPQFDMNRERYYDATDQVWYYGPDMRGKRFSFWNFKYLYAAVKSIANTVSTSYSFVLQMVTSISEQLRSKSDIIHTHTISDLPTAEYDEADPNKLVLSSDPRLSRSNAPHAFEHATGGNDAITPVMIGALTADEAGQLADNARDQAVAIVMGGATTETLDTIKEIADALDNDPNIVTTLQNVQGQHVSNSDIHITAQERLDWNAMLNSGDSLLNLRRSIAYNIFSSYPDSYSAQYITSSPTNLIASTLQNNQFIYSTDGIRWNTINFGFGVGDLEIKKIKFSGSLNLFYGIAYDSIQSEYHVFTYNLDNNSYQYSPITDIFVNETYIPTDVISVSNRLTVTAYKDDLFSKNNVMILYLVDSYNLINRYDIKSLGGWENSINSIAYSPIDDTYIAVGNRSIYRFNESAQTFAFKAAPSVNRKSIIYDDRSNNFIAIGNFNSIFTTFTVLSDATYSDKFIIGIGVTKSILKFCDLFQVFYSVSDDGYHLLTSNDGANWSIASRFATPITSIEFAENLGCFIATTNNAEILRSIPVVP